MEIAPEGLRSDFELLEIDLEPVFDQKSIFGIFLLSIGSNILISGSQTLAILLGVNEIIIGLTIVATGTSLPELATSIIAAFRGNTDLAIGNVVGSNLLNQLLILGSCSFFSGF